MKKEFRIQVDPTGKSENEIVEEVMNQVKQSLKGKDENPTKLEIIAIDKGDEEGFDVELSLNGSNEEILAMLVTTTAFTLQKLGIDDVGLLMEISGAIIAETLRDSDIDIECL